MASDLSHTVPISLDTRGPAIPGPWRRLQAHRHNDIKPQVRSGRAATVGSCTSAAHEQQDRAVHGNSKSRGESEHMKVTMQHSSIRRISWCPELLPGPWPHTHGTIPPLEEPCSCPGKTDGTPPFLTPRPAGYFYGEKFSSAPHSWFYCNRGLAQSHRPSPPGLGQVMTHAAKCASLLAGGLATAVMLSFHHPNDLDQFLGESRPSRQTRNTAFRTDNSTTPVS